MTARQTAMGQHGVGIPCVTLREQTERPATLDFGTKRLPPWPLSETGIPNMYRAARAAERIAPGTRVPEGWDGRAADRVIEALTSAVPMKPGIASAGAR